jgi:hypothetical protein
MFEVNRTGLTSNTFSVLVQISGVTNIWILSVSYFAISKTFPHHLNSFDNVPVNYNNGPLINLTVSNSLRPNYYFNIINYTAQAIANGNIHQYFSLPLSNSKIVPFITSLFVSGPATSIVYPLDLRV